MKLSSPKDLETLASKSYSFNQGTAPSRFDKICAPLKGPVLDRSKPKYFKKKEKILKPTHAVFKHYHGWTQFKKNITEFKLNCLAKSNQCCLLWFRVEYTALTQAKHEEECFITYPCSRVFFNQLRSLRISDETSFRMFDIASKILREIRS